MTIKYLSGLFIGFCVFASCTKMDDIYKDYIVPNGYTYPGKPDSVTYRTGFKRIELSWVLNADPLVVKTRVRWNEDEGYIDFDVMPNSGRVTKDFPLEEGVYTFQLRTINTKGDLSIPAEVTTEVFGDRYAGNLSNRSFSAVSYENDTFVVHWDAAIFSVAYATLFYTDIADAANPVQKSLRIENSDLVTTLPDIKLGNSISIVTSYNLTGGLDTVDSHPIEFALDALITE